MRSWGYDPACYWVFLSVHGMYHIRPGKKLSLEIENPPHKYPALLLARMATHDGLRGQGIGREMLKHVFAIAFRLTEQIGCRFVKVDAKRDPKTIRFYENYGGFIKITQNSETIQMAVDLNKISDEENSIRI